MTKPMVLGIPTPGAKGEKKVAGEALYALDVALPDMLWTKVLRSPLAHVRTGRIDVSKAGQLRGVRVSSREKISGAKVSKSIIHMPILAEDVVRFTPTPRRLPM